MWFRADASISQVKHEAVDVPAMRAHLLMEYIVAIIFYGMVDCGEMILRMKLVINVPQRSIFRNF